MCTLSDTTSCVGDDNDEDDNDDDDDDDDNDVDVPVLSPCAGDELGREDLAAHIVPAFHHSAELPPDRDLDEFENFVDNCYNHDYDHCDGQSPTGGAFSISGGFVSCIGKKSRSGQVQLEVLKYSITYFWVTYLILGISGYVGISEYFGYFRVFWVFKLYLT